jgi:hypothetical protein
MTRGVAGSNRLSAFLLACGSLGRRSRVWPESLSAGKPSEEGRLHDPVALPGAAKH